MWTQVAIPNNFSTTTLKFQESLKRWVVLRCFYSVILCRKQVTNLSWRMNSTSCPEWQVLMQFTQIALRSVVLHVWHLEVKKHVSLHICTYHCTTCKEVKGVNLL